MGGLIIFVLFIAIIVITVGRLGIINSPVLSRGWLSVSSLLNGSGLKRVADFLEENFPFYRTLNAGEKKLFTYRTLQIAQFKNFSGEQGLVVTDDMVMYVSAVWAQITFGLNTYISKDYTTIKLFPSKIVSATGNEFFGTTSMHLDEVKISYKHLRMGITGATDGFNPGLYFFARVLVKDYATYSQIERSFNEWSRYADNMLDSVPKDELTKVFTDDSFECSTDLWEVCVEAFFEKPQALSETFPKLYDLTSKVLKQDMLKRVGAISPGRAPSNLL